MEIAFTHGSLILEDRILEDGAVLVEQGVIRWIGPTAELPRTPEQVIDLGGFYLSPGFIDLHVHGGGGQEVNGADPATLKSICKVHEQFGTTSLCLAVMTAPQEQMHQSLDAIHQLAAAGTGGARLLGSYLEGPFISPARAGAHQVDHILEPDLDALKRLAVSAGGWLRVVALAPELPGSDQLVEWLARDMGLVAAIGHSSATLEQANKAFAQGCSLATHLFNGSKPFHHRDPNVSGAVLAHDTVRAEIILDHVHLHRAASRIAYKCLGPDRFCLITDATAVVGSENGRGTMVGLPIAYEDGAAHFVDNDRIAGSALTMIDAVRNMIDLFGLPYPVAIRSASLVPAQVLGISDRLGSIAVGKHADLLVLDKSDLRVLYSYVGGLRIFRSPY